jgi:hypothetical protein
LVNSDDHPIIQAMKQKVEVLQKEWDWSRKPIRFSTKDTKRVGNFIWEFIFDNFNQVFTLCIKSGQNMQKSKDKPIKLGGALDTSGKIK